MAARRFEFSKIESDERPAAKMEARAFEQNFQMALLLSLLQRGMLTQWQFDSCEAEVRKTNAGKNKVCF